MQLRPTNQLEQSRLHSRLIFPCERHEKTHFPIRLTFTKITSVVELKSPLRVYQYYFWNCPKTIRPYSNAWRTSRNSVLPATPPSFTSLSSVRTAFSSNRVPMKVGAWPLTTNSSLKADYLPYLVLFSSLLRVILTRSRVGALQNLELAY